MVIIIAIIIITTISSMNNVIVCCGLQSSSPAEIAWEAVGGVTYIRPTAVSTTLPVALQTSSCSEWRRHGLHLIPQASQSTQNVLLYNTRGSGKTVENFTHACIWLFGLDDTGLCCACPLAKESLDKALSFS